MDALDQLFSQLARAARTAGAADRPIAIKEILDTLVPYKAVRTLGVADTNDDYLHVVMRLVSGERGYCFGDDTLQDDLTKELRSPNPDLFVLRTYANATVRLATAEVARVLSGGAASSAPSAPAPAAPAPAAPAPTPAPVAAPVAAPAPPPTPAPMTDPMPEPTPAPSPASEPEGPACGTCAQPLPDDREVRFCPWCGIDQTIRRCPGCGTELDTAWRFCVTCGKQA